MTCFVINTGQHTVSNCLTCQSFERVFGHPVILQRYENKRNLWWLILKEFSQNQQNGVLSIVKSDKFQRDKYSTEIPGNISNSTNLTIH